METQTLDKTAAGLVDELIDKYFDNGKGSTEVLSALETVLPEVSNKFQTIQEKEVLKTALSTETAWLIKGLMEQGTEESLTTAIAKVRQLRGLVEVRSIPTFAFRVSELKLAFKVLGDPNLSLERHINAKLGSDASYLIEDLKLIGVQLDQGKVSEHSIAVLSSVSNNKTYSDQQGFYGNGLACPYDAVNIAMEAFCAAKEAGIDLRAINGESCGNKGVRVKSKAVANELDEATVTLLKMLAEGSIRFDNGSGPGAVGVDADGRLRAYSDFEDSCSPSDWAFGASTAEEYQNLTVNAWILGINRFF